MGRYIGGLWSSRRVAATCGSAWVGGGLALRSAVSAGCLAVVVLLGAIQTASGADAAPAAAAAPQTPNQRALAWVDGFASKQVLFHEQDITRLRKKLTEAPPEKAQQWLDETAELRHKLDSPEWQKTRKWLGEFLKVQAIYSDKELDEFRKEIMTGTPFEVGKMMQEMEDRRSTLANKSANAARYRQQTMEVNKAFNQEQHAQRQAARRAASHAAVKGGGAGTANVAKKPSYAARSASRAPLVNSLDAARIGVYRSIWPRW